MPRIVQLNRSGFLLFAAALSGCMIGAKAERFRPANLPAGSEVRVTLRTSRVIRGELLAVEDTSILVLVVAAGEPGPWIMRFGPAMTRSAGVSGIGYVMYNRRVVTGRALGEARIRSRYPQGMSAELLASLLLAYNQPGVVPANR